MEAFLKLLLSVVRFDGVKRLVVVRRYVSALGLRFFF